MAEDRKLNTQYLSSTISGNDEQLVEDYKICKTIMQKASRNYSFASVFLPANKLHHVEALYAFFRIGDDRVDVSHEGFHSSEEAIDNWESLYWKAFSTGSSSHPVLRAYLNTANTFNIPASLMESYFVSMRTDLRQTRYFAFDDLMRYIEGSAIPVGRGMTYILGVKKGYTIAEVFKGADSLSIAMQLSNFWRDIGDDYFNRNRIYIPLEDMDRFQYSEKELSIKKINENFRDLLEYQFLRTRQYYTIAEKYIKYLNQGRWGVYSSSEIYHYIIQSIRKNDYDVFTKRAVTSKLKKFQLVIKSGLCCLL